VLQNLIGEENLDPSGLRAFSGMFTNVLDVTTPGLGGAIFNSKRFCQNSGNYIQKQQ
jgi:hypothetical protein